MKLQVEQILILFIFIISCSSEDSIVERCIDESLIDSSRSCIEIYKPVCGCDGITYPNSCYATTFSGIISFTEGECE